MLHQNSSEAGRKRKSEEQDHHDMPPPKRRAVPAPSGSPSTVEHKVVSQDDGKPILRPDLYPVGWNCALPKEQTAAIAMLDRRHSDIPRMKSSSDENPPISIPADLPPTYEWRRSNDGVDLSPHLLRLRWRAWDPIESIRVLEDATDASSPQQPYGLAAHPIAAEPLTLQPVSSMVVFIFSLDMWEEIWLTEHDTHADLDDDEGLASFGARLAVPSRTDGEWGMVEDLAEEQGKDVDDDDFEIPACRRVYCCGLDRPPADGPRATIHGTGDGGVLTIGDWIMGVHALIERERENILACRGAMHGDCVSYVRPDEVLYVDPTVRFDSFDLVGDRDVISQSTWPPRTWDDTFQKWAAQPAIRAAEAERKAQKAAKIAAGMPPCLCWRSKEQPCPRATVAGAPCRPNPDTFPLHTPVGPPNTWWEVGWNGYTAAPPEVR